MRMVHPDMQPLQQLERRLCDCQIELHASGITLRDAVTRKASEYPRSNSIQFGDARIAIPARPPSQPTERLRLTWIEMGDLEQAPRASRPGGDYRVGGSSTTDQTSQFQFEFQARSEAWGNALFLFDYRSPDNFKYIGCRIGANYWTVGEYRDGAFRDLKRLPDAFSTDSRHVLDIVLDDSVVSLYANGIHKVTHDFMRSVASHQIGITCGAERLAIGGLQSIAWQPVTAAERPQTTLTGHGERPVSEPTVDPQAAATSAAIALHTAVVTTEIWGEEESPAKPVFEMREIKPHPGNLRKSKSAKSRRTDEFELYTD